MDWRFGQDNQVIRYVGNDTTVTFPAVNEFGREVQALRKVSKKDRAYDTLEHVEIPFGYYRIGDNSFEGCKNLKSIVIPYSVEMIGAYAFAGCESLEEIMILGNCDIGRNAFENTPNLKHIYLFHPAITSSNFIYWDGESNNRSSGLGNKTCKIHIHPNSVMRGFINSKQEEILTELEVKQYMQDIFQDGLEAWIISEQPTFEIDENLSRINEYYDYSSKLIFNTYYLFLGETSQNFGKLVYLDFLFMGCKKPIPTDRKELAIIKGLEKDLDITITGRAVRATEGSKYYITPVTVKCKK